MKEGSSGQATVYIAAAALVLTLISLVFGNSLIDRLSGPDVVVQRTVSDIPWPSNIVAMAGRIGSIGTMSETVTDAAMSQVRTDYF